MGRPRKTETRQSVTVRLPADLVAQLVTQAATEGTTLTSMIETALTQSNEDRQLPGTLITTTQHPDGTMTTTDSRDCPHPKAQRRVHSWGAVCGACGTRV